MPADDCLAAGPKRRSGPEPWGRPGAEPRTSPEADRESFAGQDHSPQPCPPSRSGLRCGRGRLGAGRLRGRRCACAGAPAPAPAPAPPAATPNPEALAWTGSVCSAIGPVVATLKAPPAIDQNALPDTRQAYLNHLDDAVGRTDTALRELATAGPPPIENGPQLADQVRTQVNELRADLTQARADVAGADPAALGPAIRIRRISATQSVWARDRSGANWSVTCGRQRTRPAPSADLGCRGCPILDVCPMCRPTVTGARTPSRTPSPT